MASSTLFASILSALMLLATTSKASEPLASKQPKTLPRQELNAAPLVVPFCQTEFDKLTTENASANQWKESAPAATGQRAFRSPTKKFGTWLEATYSEAEHTLSLYVVSGSTGKEIKFSKDCTGTTLKAKAFDMKSIAPDFKARWFDDKALAKLIKENPKGMIYVWSPGMVYSVKFYHYFQETAAKMKLKFVPVLGPRVNINEVSSITRELKAPYSRVKMNSVELYMRNTTSHFPTTLIFKEGKINNLPIVGVMEKDELERTVKDRLETL